MKIGIATNFYHPSVGGAELVAKTIADYLAKDHEIVIFTRKIKERSLSTYPYKIIEYQPNDMVGFIKRLNNTNLDIIFVYSDVFDFFRYIIDNKKSQVPLVLALCGGNWLATHRNYLNILYRNLHKIKSIICHSKCERDYRMCSTDKFLEKLHVIPNGVWLNEFDDNKLTKTDLAPDIKDKMWLLNVSNFFPGKGQEHLLKIVNRLPDKENIAYVQIANDISFDVGERLENAWKANSLKIKNSGVDVVLKKNLPREHVVGFFKQSNVFVFTSEKEVAPIVLLEAMAASLPWAATNVGNAIDLQGGSVIRAIKDSRFHSVFNNTVISSFLNEVPKLWNSPKIAESGRRQIEEEMSWEKILPQYKALIEHA